MIRPDVKEVLRLDGIHRCIESGDWNGHWARWTVSQRRTSFKAYEADFALLHAHHAVTQ